MNYFILLNLYKNKINYYHPSSMYTSVETQNESSFVYNHFQTEITSNNNNNQHFSDIELSTSSNHKDKCILIKNCFQHNNNTSNHNNNHHADLSHSDSDVNVNALESLRISYSFSETKDNEDTLLERINNGNNVTGHKHKKQIISLKNTDIKPKQKVNVLSLPENSIEHNYYALKKKNQTTKSIKTKLLKNYPLFLKKTNFPLPLQQPLIRHNNNNNNNNKRNTGISLQHSTINTGRNHQNKLTNKLNNTTVSAVKPKIGVYIHNTTNKLQTTKYRSIYSHNNKRNDKQIVNHLLKQIQFDTINTYYNNTIDYSNGISFEKGKKNQSKQKKVNTSNSAKIKKEGRVNVKKWGCNVNNTTNKKMQGGRMSMSSGKKIRRLEGQFLTEGNIVGGKGKKQNMVKKSDWDYGDLRLSGVNLMFQKNKGNKGSSFISVNNKSKSKKY